MPTKKQSKVIIAYHANCIDGFTSAWVTWKGLREVLGYKSTQIELLAMSYTPQDIQQLKVIAARDEVKSVYIVDFSVSVEVLEVLEGLCSDVTVLDHHKTAWEMYAPGDWAGKVQLGRFNLGGVEINLHKYNCGAKMCWNYFFPRTALSVAYLTPRLIEYVNDYDLWTKDLPATDAVNAYLSTVDKTLGDWEHLYLTFEDARTRVKCIDAGKVIQKYRYSVVRELVGQATEATLPTGEVGLVVNSSPQFASDVGHELALLSGTFGCTWQVEKSGDAKFSLRSCGECDVSTIAKENGGGGHKSAAGFYMGKTEFTMWLGGIPSVS